MSNLETAPSLSHAGSKQASPRPVRQLLTGKQVSLGETEGVRRLLPNLHRRLVGAWCFVDHYGPQDVADAPGMTVPPHPHIGLQTVSWLLAGDVHHRDSLGSSQLVRPGELGLMTAGRGITHAEHSPVPHPALLHGAQLWVALPEGARHTAPAWEHHPTLPVLEADGLRVTVLLGELAGAVSPGTTFSPLVGAAVSLSGGADGRLPLEPDFEYAALVMSGSAEVDGTGVAVGEMLYLGAGRRELALRADAAAEVLLLGGVPFGEQLVMWWNFVARDGDEVAAARADWERGHDRFGPVPGAGTPLVAPPLPPGRLRPGGATR